MKKMYSCFILLVLFFLTFHILSFSSSILESVRFSFSIWTNQIFPSLFPFFVLSEFFLHYGMVEFLGELFSPIMNHFFRMKKEGAFVFIMSIISGFPSNAKYTKELYLKGILEEKEASKLLTFTHFSNPLFILGTVSHFFLQNQKAGFYVLICHYGTNLIIGFLVGLFSEKIKQDSFSIKKAFTKMHEKRIHHSDSFGIVFTNAIQKSIQTLLLILGTVTTFLVFTTIINHVFPLSPIPQSLLKGLMEMTQGLKAISLLSISLKWKTILSTFLISFGGFSVHMQMKSILSDTKISYVPFFLSRVFHAFFSSFLIFLFFN